MSVYYIVDHKDACIFDLNINVQDLTSGVHPSSPWITFTLHLTFLCLTPNWVQMRTMMLMLLLPVSVSRACDCLSCVCCISRRSPRAFIPELYSRRPRCVTELPRARPFSAYTRGNTACPPIHARLFCGIRWASRGCGSPPLHVEPRFRNSQWVSSLPLSLHPSILNWSPVTNCSFGLTGSILGWK